MSSSPAWRPPRLLRRVRALPTTRRWSAWMSLAVTVSIARLPQAVVMRSQ
ncbi:hypothetical protein OHA72_27195 [Dactylosporangium sp. NBC_01737]|nr:hypothetical protein OHA72_27195 [Dactylosporangium sp. NBC_01737]